MQQTDKHGPARDDALKHETQALQRPGRSTQMDGREDDAESARPVGGLTSGTPHGMTPLEVEERSLLARHLGASVYPATRSELLATLHETHAPPRLITRIEALPDNTRFENLRDVAEKLGMHVESHRF